MEGLCIREVSGEVVSTVVAETDVARIELVRRRSVAPVTWRHQQPRTALYWFRTGVRTGRLSVSGHSHAAAYGPGSDLTVIPAGCRLDGRLDAGEISDVVIVFFGENQLERVTGISLAEPIIGFDNATIKRGLVEISTQAQCPGEFFELFMRGWAIQAMAVIAELASARKRQNDRVGGLSTRNVRVARSYIQAHLAESISVDDLAAQCLVSRRHFIRAFAESFGTTPARYVADVRLATAKRLLATHAIDIRAVAAACGYAHQQHFANRFKAATGFTPSQFRTATRTRS